MSLHTSVTGVRVGLLSPVCVRAVPSWAGSRCGNTIHRQ